MVHRRWTSCVEQDGASDCEQMEGGAGPHTATQRHSQPFQRVGGTRPSSPDPRRPLREDILDTSSRARPHWAVGWAYEVVASLDDEAVLVEQNYCPSSWVLTRTFAPNNTMRHLPEQTRREVIKLHHPRLPHPPPPPPAAHSLVTSFSSVGESDRVASYRRRRPWCGSSEARSAVGPPDAHERAGARADGRADGPTSERTGERAGERMNGRAE